MNRWHIWWRTLAIAFDTAALVAALGGAAFLRFGPRVALDYMTPESLSFSAPWPLAVGIFLVAMGVFGLYNPTRCANGVEEARRIVSASLAAPTAIVLASFLLHQSPSRLWIVTGTLGSLATVAIGRRALRLTVGRLRRSGHLVTPSVIVGGNDAKTLIDTLAFEPQWGALPVATCGFVFGELPSYEISDIATAVRDTGARGVVIVAADMDRRDVTDAVAVCDDLGVGATVVPGLDYMLLHNINLVALGPEPALVLEQPHLRWHQRAMKRSMDIVGSFYGLVLLAPFFAALAVAIKLDSKGPVFFKQQRVGERGKHFTVWKFRTMVENAHEMRHEIEEHNEMDGTLFKVTDDPRITRMGKLIRKFSLDEFPQLWNVLRGEMSLVGPRPALPEEVETYETELRRRLHVRPGMTGLWQVSGRSDLPFEDYVRLDLTYVRNWGVLLDVYILLRTASVVLGAKGAY